MIDDNIISGYFSGSFNKDVTSFITDIIDRTPNISVVTQIEALSWVNSNKAKETVVRTFVEDADILELTSVVVAQCVKIRRSRKMKTPDAIIAATAIVNDMTLLTKDSGFLNIEGLKILNPINL